MNRTLKLVTSAVAATAVCAGVAVAATSPSVSTGGVSAVGQTSAVLHGRINPNGATTSYRFEWGLSNAYGLSSTVRSAGNGTKQVNVTTAATGLIPGTVYHYRLDALNRFGGALGSDHTFKTAGNPPPGAVTGPVSALSAGSATVTGVVNPNSETTTWWVQFGLTAAYGLRTDDQTIPGTVVPIPVAFQLKGLHPGTVFHYRVVARHGNSVIEAGADQTFVTYPSPRPKPRVSAKTTPSRDRTKPYRFTTSGRVSTVRWMPRYVQCAGEVLIRFHNGKRQLDTNLVPVSPNCTFSGQSTFRHRPGRSPQAHLRVTIHFEGTHYLAPADARPESVTLG